MSTEFKGKVLDAEPKTNYFIRTVVLVLLCLQNAGHALLARYSQGILKEEYSSSEVVLVGEFIKLAVSGYLAYVDRSETGMFS
jgi:Nucleotide-sugar transporter